MLWSRKPVQKTNPPKVLTFKVECIHCAEVYEITVEVGVVQLAKGLCPDCDYLRFLERDMLDTLNDWHEPWIDQ